MNKKDLIEEFIEGAKLYNIGMKEKNPDKANIGSHKVMNAYKKIKAKNPNLSSLLPLLRHDNISVRSAAAARVLLIKPDVALSVLLEISKSKEKPFSFNAMMVIKQWQKGQLRFDDSND